MPFRLIYRGFLPAEGSGDSRRKLKHSIRKQFHPQLKELWERNPYLKRRKALHSHRGATALDELADNYARCGFRFAPLISKRNGLGCSLDIVFLRRDEPGDIMRGGDLDNRLKTLNDGFKVPTECSQVEGFAPDADENPFFCLMEDDSLITEVKITTDRLLTPVEQHENEVLLIVQATAIVIDPNNTWPGLHV
jgi:hypothetical protein